MVKSRDPHLVDREKPWNFTYTETCFTIKRNDVNSRKGRNSDDTHGTDTQNDPFWPKCCATVSPKMAQQEWEDITNGILWDFIVVECGMNGIPSRINMYKR